jgi:hypothetical protein
MSAGEIFAYVTALEYAYDHSPKDMKAIVQAINLLIGGIGSAVTLALTAVAHDPNLLVFYASLTGVMAVTAVVFWSLFRKYDNLRAIASDNHLLKRTSTDLEHGQVAATRDPNVVQPDVAATRVEMHLNIDNDGHLSGRPNATLVIKPDSDDAQSRQPLLCSRSEA